MKKRNHVRIKPRNPLVAAARFRHAGAHDRRARSRQAAQQALRAEVRALSAGP
jgi:hypothetical protein